MVTFTLTIAGAGYTQLAPLAAASNDADAGAWQMIVQTSPTQFAVTLPAQVTSLGYQAELASIKSAQSQLTANQRKSIDYWSKGGVLRWNEVLLGASYFDAQKEEAAISRLYGGIHYRSDIEVGKAHGKRIGDYTVRFMARRSRSGPRLLRRSLVSWMTVVRVLISSFVLILIVVSVAGWIWAGSHQPPAQATASHVVLGLGILAAIVGLATVWRGRSVH